MKNSTIGTLIHGFLKDIIICKVLLIFVRDLSGVYQNLIKKSGKEILKKNIVICKVRNQGVVFS